jgi:hypothetical protein
MRPRLGPGHSVNGVILRDLGPHGTAVVYLAFGNLRLYTRYLSCGAGSGALP